MKQFNSLLLLSLLCLHVSAAFANDGVYTVSGNHLIPLKETDIALSKEILTISLQDDDMASVDVYYELMNAGQEKEVLMGFEAQPINYDQSPYNPSGINPYIKDFYVAMNGSTLAYTNHITHGPDFDATAETVCDYACVYAFKAKFKHGKNIVHHTYKYHTSYGILNAFDIAYKLTPATRWANRQIDDFTLQVKAKNTAKHFIIPNAVFSGAPFVVSEGTGKIRENTSPTRGHVVEVSLRNGTLKWQKNSFRPTAELSILSADELFRGKSCSLGSFYDRGRIYSINIQNDGSATDGHVLRNLPYASRGHIFKNAKLKQYFESLWWYMPDSLYRDATADFTEQERGYVGIKKSK